MIPNYYFIDSNFEEGDAVLLRLFLHISLSNPSTFEISPIKPLCNVGESYES